MGTALLFLGAGEINFGRILEDTTPSYWCLHVQSAHGLY